MERREANLAFHHAERLKSNIFLLTAALSSIAGLKGDQLEGAKEVTRGIFAALNTELRLAKGYLSVAEVEPIEQKLAEAQGNLELNEHQQALQSLAEAVSRVTTASARYCDELEREGLI